MMTPCEPELNFKISSRRNLPTEQDETKAHLPKSLNNSQEKLKTGKFLDENSSDSIAIDGEEDLQSIGMEEIMSEVPKEAEKNAEPFQEQRGRRPKKKQAVRSKGGKISLCTHSRSPLLSSLHVNTECHSTLSSSVLAHPMFAIDSVAKPGLLELFAD